VSDTFFCNVFLPKPSAYRCGPPMVRGPEFDKHWLSWYRQFR